LRKKPCWSGGIGSKRGAPIFCISFVLLIGHLPLVA
jgi:hypothetical protein